MRLNKATLSLICLLASFSLYAQGPQAYQIFNNKGKKVRYNRMLNDLSQADVVLFGELHNNPIVHWLQLEFSRELYAIKGSNLFFGAEMFEADNQEILSEYLGGYISESSYNKEMRLWPNYKTDYKPLVEFAKENELSFIATNVPRRYASSVFYNGLTYLEELPEASQKYFAPLPIAEDYEVTCYKEMLDMSMGHGGAVDKKFPQAQMIKDATMAHFINKNLGPEKLCLHFNGSFHSDRGEGIAWYLKKMNPDLKIVVISAVEEDDVKDLDYENKNKGNYIIAVPNRMTKTH